MQNYKGRDVYTSANVQCTNSFIIIIIFIVSLLPSPTIIANPTFRPLSLDFIGSVGFFLLPACSVSIAEALLAVDPAPLVAMI